MLFLCYFVCALWGAKYVAEPLKQVYRWTAVVGLVMVMSGILVMAWRYLP